MKIRQREWNNSVKQYIVERPHAAHLKSGQVIPLRRDEAPPDKRAPLNICKAAVIKNLGGPRYSQCGAPNCARIEDKPSEFKKCAACRVTPYCSLECSTAAWRHCHKVVCGSVETEPRLFSEIAVSEKAKTLVYKNNRKYL